MRAIKVLIIDEESEFTSILTDRLRSWGFEASAANSEEDALEALTISRPDVVVLCLKAQDNKGFDILCKIKALDPAIEVILLTGKGTAITGMKGIERGAFDVLPQPIELGVLIDKIRLAAGGNPVR
jgi:DNA-binding response OmpR family regulator